MAGGTSHTYTVLNASYIDSGIPGSDPQVTIIGSVDGIDVTVLMWLSAIQQAQTKGGMASVQNLIAPVMLAQSVLNAPPAPAAVVQLPTGTFIL